MPTSLTTSTLPGGFSLPDAPAPGSGPDRDPEVSTTSPAGRGLIAPSPDPTEERLPEEAGAGREEPTAGDADRRAEPTIEAVPQVPEVIIPPGVVPVPVPSDPVPVPESPAILPEDLPSTPATPMAQEPERAPADSVPPAASDVANSDHAAGGDWGPLGGARPQAPSRRDDGPLDPPPPPAPSANSTPPVADGPDLAEPGPGPDVPPAVTPSVGPDAAPAPAEEMPPALDGQPPIDLPAAAPAPTGDAPNPGDDPHAEVPAPAPTGDVPNLGDLPLPEVPAPPGDADANPPGDLPPPSAPAPDEALEPAIPPPTSPEPGPPAPPVPGDVPAPARDGAAPPAEVPAPAEAAPLPGDAPAPVAPEPVEAPESLLDQLPGIPPLPLEEDKTASAAVARFRPAPARVVLERVFGQPLGGLRGPDLRPRPPATPEARAALAAMRRRLDDSRRPGPEQVAARILR